MQNNTQELADYLMKATNRETNKEPSAPMTDEDKMKLERKKIRDREMKKFKMILSSSDYLGLEKCIEDNKQGKITSSEYTEKMNMYMLIFKKRLNELKTQQQQQSQSQSQSQQQSQSQSVTGVNKRIVINPNNNVTQNSIINKTLSDREKEERISNIMNSLPIDKRSLLITFLKLKKEEKNGFLKKHPELISILRKINPQTPPPPSSSPTQMNSTSSYHNMNYFPTPTSEINSMMSSRGKMAGFKGNNDVTSSKTFSLPNNQQQQQQWFMNNRTTKQRNNINDSSNNNINKFTKPLTKKRNVDQISMSGRRTHSLEQYTQQKKQKTSITSSHSSNENKKMKVQTKSQKKMEDLHDDDIDTINDVTNIAGVNLENEDNLIYDDLDASKGDREQYELDEKPHLLNMGPLNNKLLLKMKKENINFMDQNVKKLVSLSVEDLMTTVIGDLIKRSNHRKDNLELTQSYGSKSKNIYDKLCKNSENVKFVQHPNKKKKSKTDPSPHKIKDDVTVNDYTNMSQESIVDLIGDFGNNKKKKKILFDFASKPKESVGNRKDKLEKKSNYPTLLKKDMIDFMEQHPKWKKSKILFRSYDRGDVNLVK